MSEGPPEKPVVTPRVGGPEAPQAARGDLFQRMRAFFDSLRSPELEPFFEAWPRSLQRRSVAPTALPVLRWLATLEAPGSGPMGELLHEVRCVAGSLAWHQSYDASQVSAQFLENYGWAEIAGLAGQVPSASLACGLLLLGPNTFYPPHRHEAEEIYIPLSGTAAWQKGQEDWREHSPGSIIHHARHLPHSMRTAGSALLAVYLWRSESLEQKSRLHPTEAGPAR